MTATVASQPTIDYGHVEVLPVHFDDLDPMGMVHNARYAVLIEARVGHVLGTPRPHLS